jgi:hypothetical protein
MQANPHRVGRFQERKRVHKFRPKKSLEKTFGFPGGGDKVEQTVKNSILRKQETEIG